MYRYHKIVLIFQFLMLLQTMDILALHQVVENLKLSKDQVNDTSSRHDWKRRVDKFTPVIERILFARGDDYQYGEECENALESLRYVLDVKHYTLHNKYLYTHQFESISFLEHSLN